MNDSKVALNAESYIATDHRIVDESYATYRQFDKIINVKFQRAKIDAGSQKNYFCIRSDYEPRFHDDGSIYFLKCEPKPSIKVSYSQVSDSTAIAIKLEIEALFVDREASGEAFDSASGNPIQWATIQLGYFGEFPRWDRMPLGTDVDLFYSMDDPAFNASNGARYGKQLLAQIISCYQEGDPGERKWVFNGVVATLETGLSWPHDDSYLVPGYKNPDFPRGMCKLESMLFQFVTRRFISANVQHYTVTVPKEVKQGANKTTIQVVEYHVKAYGQYKSPQSRDKNYTKLDMDNDGLFKPSDARMLGVRCILSEKLRTLEFGKDFPRTGLLGPLFTQKTVNEKFTAMPTADYSFFDDAQNTLGAQLKVIKDHFNYLRWYVMLDGSIFFYHVDETSATLFDDPYIKDKQKSAVPLPAIYDITMSGTRTIRCPFNKLLNPMDTVLFQSRYRLMDTTGFFFQPERTHDSFLIILSELEFSTAGDENMLTLMCVDIPDAQAPIVNPLTGEITPVEGTPRSEQDYTDSVAKREEARVKNWYQYNYKLSDTAPAPYNKYGATWVDFARNLMFDTADEDWPSGKPTLKKALQDLKAWNSSAGGVWTVAREKRDEQTNPASYLARVAGFTDPIPWLYSGDTVIIKHPYKASYDNSFKQSEASVNG